MEDKKIAIRADQITKIYKLYEKPSDRMKEALGLTRKKLHKEHYALQGVDMTVYQGETVGIIGTNGSGKSTILKIITGVLNPTQGELTVNGRISALLELGAGFNMEYNGIENVYLNGTMMGFSKKEIDAKMEDIIEKVIEQFDKEPFTKTFAVNHTTPAEMANMICQVFFEKDIKNHKKIKDYYKEFYAKEEDWWQPEN